MLIKFNIQDDLGQLLKAKAGHYGLADYMRRLVARDLGVGLAEPSLPVAPPTPTPTAPPPPPLKSTPRDFSSIDIKVVEGRTWFSTHHLCRALGIPKQDLLDQLDDEDISCHVGGTSSVSECGASTAAAIAKGEGLRTDDFEAWLGQTLEANALV